MDDLISRAEAIDDLHGKDPSQIWDTADIEVWVNALPSSQPEKRTEKRAETHDVCFDTISRAAAIDALSRCQTYLFDTRDTDRKISLEDAEYVIEKLPSAQPEHLSDDDFEAIRIHLNAYKERLCNQHRYAEAEEYQQLIDRFMSFAEAQPEIIRCKDCRYWQDNNGGYPHDESRWNKDETPDEDDYCSCAERREVSE